MRKLNKNTGITLISLVITIIIMLILVGVSINLAVNGGLFEYAGNAVGDTKNAMKNEQDLVDDIIENYIKPNTANNGEDENGETTPENYIGYYADIDGNGTVDGVIYADLAFSKSGTWNPAGNTGIQERTGGTWKYSAVSNLKEYIVSEENYEGAFGTKPVIKASGTEGVDRFYVMALSDENTGKNYCWYDAAYDSGIQDYTSYSYEFGTGKTNTHNMIKAWNDVKYGVKDDNSSYKDVWGEIQETVYGKNYEKEKKEVDDVIWFIPSANEWAAFGSAFGITTENYKSTYGMDKKWYWSSSVCDWYNAYYINFTNGYMTSKWLSTAEHVRFSATF